ncbi:DUF6624 domain-containing protein [Mucilaginibacter pedocola]|nr:DUF6624 domain-containing protein [Mucilaginibacter pedocola]
MKRVVWLFLFALLAVGAQAQINKPLKRELDSLYALDQKYRALTSGKRDSALTDSLAKVYHVSPTDVSAHLWKLQNEADSASLKRVEAIIKQYGYPGKTLVGEPTNQAAFFILQHSNKIGQYIDVVKTAAEKHELPFARYAMMQDRWLMYNNEPQVYGTQLKGMNIKNPETGKVAWKFFIWPIADPQNVNQRRQQAGIEKTIEEYARGVGLTYKAYTLDDVKSGKIE